MPDVYPNESWQADASVEQLDGTTDEVTGLPYVAKGVGPTSTPSYEVQYNRRQQRLNSMLATWRQGQVVDEGQLRIGIYPLNYSRGTAELHFAGATGLAVPDEAMRCVYLNQNNQLQIAEGWPGDRTSYVALARVTTSGGSMVVTDQRIIMAVRVPLFCSSGDGLAVSAGQVSVAVSDFAGEGLEDDGADDLRVKLDGTTIARGASGVKVGDNVLDGQQAANIGANGGLPVIFTATVTGGSTVAIHISNAPFKYRVIDAWSVAASGDGGSWYLNDGTNAITDTVTVTGTDKTIDRAGQVDDAYSEIAANGSLRVVGDGANADVEVYVMAVRVS